MFYTLLMLWKLLVEDVALPLDCEAERLDE